jgi:hypothetical protein
MVSLSKPFMNEREEREREGGSVKKTVSSATMIRTVSVSHDIRSVSDVLSQRGTQYEHILGSV